MKALTIFHILVFVISSLWIIIEIVPKFPNFIEYLSVVIAPVSLGYSFYYLVQSATRIIKEQEKVVN